MRFRLLVLVTAICFAFSVGRADYLLTWEAPSSLFQASFEVTDAEAQPGQVYYPSNYPLSLTNSISITSPDGNTFQWGYVSTEGQDRFSMIGSGLPPAFAIDLFVPSTSQWDALSVYAYPNGIMEFGWNSGSSTVLYTEYGPWWNVTYIPEPSTAALALGAAACWSKRMRLLPAFKPA
jgi:hypothetical protein